MNAVVNILKRELIATHAAVKRSKERQEQLKEELANEVEHQKTLDSRMIEIHEATKLLGGSADDDNAGTTSTK